MLLEHAAQFALRDRMRLFSVGSSRSRSKTSEHPPPSSLARVIAKSASRSSMVGGLVPGPAMATPTLAAHAHQARQRSRMACSMCSMQDAQATASRSLWSTMFSISTPNSSPPSRAAESSGRSEAFSLSATASSSASPAGLAERLVDLFEAVQIEQQHSAVLIPPRDRRDRARVSRSRNSARLASPVENVEQRVHAAPWLHSACGR